MWFPEKFINEFRSEIFGNDFGWKEIFRFHFSAPKRQLWPKMFSLFNWTLNGFPWIIKFRECYKYCNQNLSRRFFFSEKVSKIFKNMFFPFKLPLPMGLFTKDVILKEWDVATGKTLQIPKKRFPRKLSWELILTSQHNSNNKAFSRLKTEKNLSKISNLKFNQMKIQFNT